MRSALGQTGNFWYHRPNVNESGCQVSSNARLADELFYLKQFFSTLPRNIIGCFKGWLVVWHVIAIVLTIVFVRSDLDWIYFLHTRSPVLRSWAFPAVRIGGELPLVLPLVLLLFGVLLRSGKSLSLGFAVAQSVMLGSLISSTYKVFTGRIQPPHGTKTDLSHFFRFGILRGGIYWGWPSSHTTIAFAMSTTIFVLLPRQRVIGFLALIYAFYVGLGVSVTIHWFSDFIAGAIIGTIIGIVVGKSFSVKRMGAWQQDAPLPISAP